MLLVLKTAPFVENSEDLSSFIACFTLTLTFVGGFALISEADKDANAERTYDPDLLAYLLIGINVACVIIELSIFVIVDVGGCVGSLVKAQRALKHSDALGNTAMFGSLPSEARAAVIDIMQIRQVQKGDHIVTQGDIATEFMVIMKGTASVLINGVEVRKFKRLDMLGESTLIAVDAMPIRGATVKVIKDVTLLVLDRNEYRHLVDSSGYEWSVHDTKMRAHARKASTHYSNQDLKREKSSGSNNNNSTKVVPLLPPPPPPLLSSRQQRQQEETKQETVHRLREIRKQFGAGSEEYKNAAMNVGN
jgi:hypothetical protein